MSEPSARRTDVHPSVLGYQTASDEYERGRPSYPSAAVDSLVRGLQIAPGKLVLEIGAGTGKFTRMLQPTGAQLIAVEPVESMRVKLKELSGSVRVLEGTAEHLPVESGSIDAVVVAQAFHWFDGTAALAEIHRVLRPGGSLGLIWNVRDERSSLQQRLTKVIDRYDDDSPRFASGRWRAPFDCTTAFTALESKDFKHEQVGDGTLVLARVLSISFIAKLPAVEREAVAEAVRQVLADAPEAQNPERVILPYRTSIYWCRRL